MHTDSKVNICVYLRNCFMKSSLQSSEGDWNEIFMEIVL